jgi:hypothetical protein
MKLGALCAAVALLLNSAAYAQNFGVAVQVSNGKAVPTVGQLSLVLPPGGFVRDVLGWHKVDRGCNLRNNPAERLAIPSAMSALYQAVQTVGGKNFVTLAFANRYCGEVANSGARAFPNTPMLRAEFAAYAAAVVRQVPAIGGVSIWNEFNGAWSGGYTDYAQKLTDYCLLSNAVIAEIRKVDPNIPIAIGATVGADVGQWFIDMFERYGCVGAGDPTVWLDVHPYLSGKIIGSQLDWKVWYDSVALIRAHGITNPLVATEWGAKAAYQWNLAHPKGSYLNFFQTHVIGQDPNWAGLMWYQMLYDRRTPNAGLFDQDGSLNARGTDYINELLQ